MPTQPDVKVYPRGRSWAVAVEGEPDPRSEYADRRAAIRAGQETAQELGVDLLVEGRDGRIEAMQPDNERARELAQLPQREGT